MKNHPKVNRQLPSQVVQARLGPPHQKQTVEQVQLHPQGQLPHDGPGVFALFRWLLRVDPVVGGPEEHVDEGGQAVARGPVGTYTSADVKRPDGDARVGVLGSTGEAELSDEEAKELHKLKAELLQAVGEKDTSLISRNIYFNGYKSEMKLAGLEDQNE